ncbi:unnamed protein product [Cuscuta campestris]|uniref:Uncharacterized protein n=1 Tax=Cuscuta campestris TaxID=132261 RepID=A0A484N7H7_9ASTE|nr:unnamed protein product [Cuscuta campestris]
MIFTAQVSFMGFFFLFQDKWEYIKKQGDMVVGNEPKTTAVVATTTTLCEVVVDAAETYRRSNALGTYFSRSKALKKLFQQTSW